MPDASESGLLRPIVRYEAAGVESLSRRGPRQKSTIATQACFAT